MSKTAVVTGAASGLGYELMLLLAKDAYDLVLIDVDSKKLSAVKTLVETQFNSQVQTIVADLSAVDSAEFVYNTIKSKTIDVLI